MSYKLELRLPGPQICGWYHSNGRKWRGTKEPLGEGEGREWKFSVQKTKIMASSPITSWKIDGGKVEIVSDFIFLGSKITVDDDCSHKIKRHLLLGRKARTNLDSLLKSRDHFADKDLYSQNYEFSSSHVWMWELDCKEGWVPKNWCFELWC